MKKWSCFIALIAAVFLWSGCSKGGGKSSDTELPEEDNATEITIEVQDYNTNFYVKAAKMFEEETGVKVNVINTVMGQTNEELFALWSTNKDRITAELMAGKGADLYAGIYLNFVDIGKNKHLCNIANWIDKDPAFSEDAYYMKVLKSGVSNGNLYSVPLFMMYSALGTTTELPELEGKNFNWEEFFELTKGLKRNGVLYGITDMELFKRRFRDRYPYFMENENKKQNLDSSEMIKLLNQCKQWSAEGLCIPFQTGNMTEVFEKALFKEPGGSDMYMLTNFRFDNPHEKEQYYYYDIPSDSGLNDKANKIMPSDLICINGASPHKGTAWKFLKFLLSEEVQSTAFFSPINRKAADYHLRKGLNEIIDYFGLEVDADEIVKESEAILDGVQQISNSVNESEVEKIIFDEAVRVFRGEISADTAAKNMAARVKLYRKEL